MGRSVFSKSSLHLSNFEFLFHRTSEPSNLGSQATSSSQGKRMITTTVSRFTAITIGKSTVILILSKTLEKESNENGFSLSYMMFIEKTLLCAQVRSRNCIYTLLDPIFNENSDFLRRHPQMSSVLFGWMKSLF